MQREGIEFKAFGIEKKHHCPECGKSDWIELAPSAGCGGRGTVKGCQNCQLVLLQDSGGVIANLEGESWRRLPYTISEYKDLSMSRARNQSSASKRRPR